MSLRENLEKLPAEHWENEHVKIKPVLTQDDLIYATYDCQLTDEQKELVNPAWFSIGRAYLCRENNYPCIIYNESDEPIGFINFSKWLAEGEAVSWSYYIDVRQQGKGYGKSAARLAIDILKAAEPGVMIKLAAETFNTKAHELYKSLGFRKLDEMDGDDYVFGL